MAQAGAPSIPATDFQQRHTMKSMLPSLLVSLALAAPAFAQQKPDTPAAAAGAALADGEVRKIDKDAAKLTLRHGEIRSLDMPPMTMVFNVRDKALLDKLEVGNKVRFAAVKEAGKYTVTEIQVVP